MLNILWKIMCFLGIKIILTYISQIVTVDFEYNVSLGNQAKIFFFKN